MERPDSRPRLCAGRDIVHVGRPAQSRAQSSFLAPTSRGQRMKSSGRFCSSCIRRESYRCSGSECFRAPLSCTNLSIRLSVRPFVRPSVRASICLSVCLYMCFLRISQRPIMPCVARPKPNETDKRAYRQNAIGTRIVRYRSERRNEALLFANRP